MKNIAIQIHRWYVWGIVPVWKSDEPTASTTATIRAVRKDKPCFLSKAALKLITDFTIATNKKSQRTFLFTLFVRLLTLSTSVSATRQHLRHVTHRSCREDLNYAAAVALWRSRSALNRCLSSRRTTHAASSKTRAVLDAAPSYDLKRVAMAAAVMGRVLRAWSNQYARKSCTRKGTWATLMLPNGITKFLNWLILWSRYFWRHRVTLNFVTRTAVPLASKVPSVGTVSISVIPTCMSAAESTFSPKGRTRHRKISPRMYRAKYQDGRMLPIADGISHSSLSWKRSRIKSGGRFLFTSTDSTTEHPLETC